MSALLNDADWNRYMADCRARPLAIDAPWPWYSKPLSIGSGALVGVGIGWTVNALATNRLLIVGLVLIGLGILSWVGWEVGISSDAACRRRYEKARIAAIYARYRELGIPS